MMCCLFLWYFEINYLNNQEISSEGRSRVDCEDENSVQQPASVTGIVLYNAFWNRTVTDYFELFRCVRLCFTTFVLYMFHTSIFKICLCSPISSIALSQVPSYRLRTSSCHGTEPVLFK
jgi:hypothetical protein